MKRRIVAMLLMLCTLAGLVLTGCGGEGGGSSSGERVTLTIGVPQNANVTSYEDNDFTRYLEEAANVDLKFVFFPANGDEYIRQLTLMAAANETMPDILWHFNNMNVVARNEFGMSGYLMDLTDLIDKYAPDYKAAMARLNEHDRRRIENRAVAEDGCMYAMPEFFDMIVWDNLQSMLLINKDWLDTLGLEMPTTPDELYTVLKAFKEEDPNGNLIADEVPLFGRTNNLYSITGWIINSFVYYNETYDYNVTDGKLWPAYTSDEYRQALIFLHKLCAEGLLSDMCFSAAQPELKAMMMPASGTAQVGIFAGHPLTDADSNSTILEQYVPMAGLGDATGKGGYIVLNPKTLVFPLMITTDCQHPEAAMRFCNLFYQDETMTRQRHGTRDVDWVEEPGLLPGGEEGYIKLVDSSAFFKGNHTWCANGGGIGTPQNYLATMDGSRRADQVIANMNKVVYEDILKNIVQPEERCEDLVYTAAQYEEHRQYITPIRSYVQEQRNLFILGTLDPNDDAQWDHYLKELDRLGLQADMELMQGIYEANLLLD